MQLNIKNIFIILLVIFSLPAFAQDKAEKKKLLAEIKALNKNLNQFKQMKEEDSQLNADILEKTRQISQRKSDTNTSAEDIKKKDEGIEYLEEQLRKLKKQYPDVNASKQGRGSHDCAFSVQIGAYKSKDLTQYMDNNANFGVETNDAGVKKYTLGYFTSYWEAKSFSKHLDGAGAQSYVVGFYKGQRIPDLKDMTQCTF